MLHFEKEGDGAPRGALPVLLLIFVLSGAAGLVYEVIWVRQLATVLGAGTYAVTIVLVAFMGGLGLGAWLCGRRADRWSPTALVRTYLLCEFGIAAYALLFPWLLRAAEHAYVLFYRSFSPEWLTFHLFKLLLALLLLVFPTVLMGATLPVLGRYLVRLQGLPDRQVARLYAANTFGGIAGTVLAGYWLLPAFGVAGGTRCALLLNLVAALGLALFHRFCKKEPKTSAPVPGGSVRPEPLRLYQLLAMAGFALSGVAAMFYQVAWTRTLSMILGNTTYAFTTMLATFLCGIALGSALYGRISARIPRSAALAGLQVTAGLSALLTIPFFERLPTLYLTLYGHFIESWPEMQLVRFALAALVMLLPTMALGATFPAVSALLVEHFDHLGRRVGTAYALNTAGAVVGAAGAGLLLVPLIGMQATIVVGVLLNLVAGLALFIFAPQLSAARRFVPVAATALIFVIGLASLQAWAPRVMNSGVYLYAPRYEGMEERYRTLADQGEEPVESRELWELSMKRYELLYYRPGVTATVAVMEEQDGTRFLTIDGKTDASTGSKSDMRTQVMISQLPLLFHEDPDKALIVGLGSGVTAGSALTHPVRAVDCAEISPAVIEAASFFSEANNDVFADPRLEILPRDARNVLLTGEQRYDVVISQPSNPWIKGEASLFTEEWYRQVHGSLTSGGLFMQWVPTYLIGERDLRIIAKTLRGVFPHVTVWTSGSLGDLIFLARRDAPLRIDFAKYLQRVQRPEVRADLQRVDLDPLTIPVELLVMDESQLEDYLAGGPGDLPKNSDDYLPLEFSAPRQLVRREQVPLFLDPQQLVQGPEEALKLLENIDPEQVQALLSSLQG